MLISDRKVPDIAKHVALSELLYIAEGTALDDPKIAKFCMIRVQQIAQGTTVPLLLKPAAVHEKIEKITRMLKHSVGDAREMPSIPKGVQQGEVN